MLLKLAQDDITKLDAVSNQNYITALNILSFWKERDERKAEVEKHNNKQ